MGKKTRRILIVILWTILVIILGTEALLRLTDPWGVNDVYDDLVLFHENFQFEPHRGYVLPEGEYRFKQWTATINAQQTRVVPDTNLDASCTIAMVGDSVTFGHGVNDDETFTNQLARHFPEVHFIDAGLNGYNIGNVLGTIRSIDADAYVYFIIHNDDDPPLQIGQEGRVTWRIVLYRFALLGMLNNDAEPDPVESEAPAEVVYPDWFMTDAQSIASYDNVLIAANEGNSLLGYIETRDVPVVTIPKTNHRVSRADPHPNAEGHAEMAQSLLPHVALWIAEHCPSAEPES
jgi:hypothetical protein